MIKRIAVFAFYDKNGVVHDYVCTYLRYLKQVADKVIFVADNEANDDQKSRVNNIIDYSIWGKHDEMDFGSYKRGFLYAKKIGWLQQADELIFANDSCFATENFNNVFDTMKKRVCDFWGMTFSTQIQPHLQSFFLVFRKKVFASNVFENFINNVCHQNSYWEYITHYELPLKTILEEAGFSSDSFVPNFVPTQCPSRFPVTILKYKYPLVKKKIFTNFDSMENTYDLLKIFQKKFPEVYADIISFCKNSDLIDFFKKFEYHRKQLRKKHFCWDYIKYKILYLLKIVSKKQMRARKDIFLIERSQFFDARWYLKTYPEVHINPAEHYLTEGWKKRYNASKRFNTQRYIDRYPMVLEKNINPLIYFETIGINEGQFPD